MRVREFTSVVSSLSNWSMAHLDRITATLRAHEMLDTGGADGPYRAGICDTIRDRLTARPLPAAVTAILRMRSTRGE